MTDEHPISEERRAELVDMLGEVAIAHSERFRKVSTRYPHEVALAYGLDLEQAAAATDEEVAAKVAEARRERGDDPLDFYAIGADERADDIE